MDRVLDLDLDFFAWPPLHESDWPNRPARTEFQKVADSAEVSQFLEAQCGLSSRQPVTGALVVHHDEAFDVWSRWLAAGRLRAPFEIVHVDAHSDLWTYGAEYLMTELLARPVEQRRDPRRGPLAMNEGNYLAFAVANHWVSQLTYVFPEIPTELAAARRERLERRGEEAPPVPTEPDDLDRLYFSGMDWRTGFLQLKYYARPAAWQDAVLSHLPGSVCPEPDKYEPKVPFRAAPASQFHVRGLTHMVVAQSPCYAPVAADALLPSILAYCKTTS
jgi:hypothetical protein